MTEQMESGVKTEDMDIHVESTPPSVAQTPVVIDIDALPSAGMQQPTPSVKEPEKAKRKYVKRKRSSMDGSAIVEDKAAFLVKCKQELGELFCYFTETLVPKVHVEGAVNITDESTIACLIEGSCLSLSKLAEEIHEKLKTREGITVQSLLRDVPFVGCRIKYGIDNGNLNIGEDESEGCLWCWEARDITLLPKKQRGILKCLRMARKKVHARINALSATLAALSRSESEDKSYLLKASEKLCQEMNLPEIRSFIEKSLHKTNVNIAEKEAKLKEKELVKEIERNKQIEEKEKKRMELEAQKEKARAEKELKRLKEEADKEEKRREKQESEIQKQLKRQQEESEKDQKRREKEEVERKKQMSMQKQATIMQRFLKRSQVSNPEDKAAKVSRNISVPRQSDTIPDAVRTVTSSMDCALAQRDCLLITELWTSHLQSWRKLWQFNRSQHWGIRQGKKIELVKELKLQGSSRMPMSSQKVTIDKGHVCTGVARGSDSNTDKLSDEEDILIIDSLDCSDVVVTPSVIQFSKNTNKLLQFDKNHRPAYYGSWSKNSSTVGPRHPFAKDPDLDYDVDSDEEWEEEEPGESLTDCDKDDEEEDCQQDLKADTDDDSEDGFFVPDGYLSENEGAQEDANSYEAVGEETRGLPGYSEQESEEFKLLSQRQKYLNSLTDKALRKSRPLIISNLTHEMSGLVISGEAHELSKTEQICIQTLCMQALHEGSVIEPPVDNSLEEDEGICPSQSISGVSPGSVTAAIPLSDLAEFVKSIQSHSQGISKVIESLQQKFPVLSKSQIRNKVKEIADFVDNHWQVKKDVLDSLGFSASPEKTAKLKGIATFFSKRCLPPAGERVVVSDLSPLRHSKTEDVPTTNIDNRSESFR